MKQLFINKSDVTVAGIMSGTSLDGMDIAICSFSKADDGWSYNILETTTIDYSPELKSALNNAPNLPPEELTLFHNHYGTYIGNEINSFLKEIPITPDLIASHGHTIFHQPEKGITFQAGNGTIIAKTTGIPVVSDFRTKDVMLGGQGAPLVPVGDHFLFSEYDYCLNLGGFSNLSFEKNGKRLAFDICPVNIVLNYFAEKEGKPFDRDGQMGRSGKLIPELFKKLNQLPYFKSKPPKSLGREWVEENFLPLCNFQTNTRDIIRTLYEHMAYQLGKALFPSGKTLITGGGAYNSFLIERMKKYTDSEIIIPSPNLVNFKEALIFAFLGLLRARGETNIFSSVTGASANSCSGTMHLP